MKEEQLLDAIGQLPEELLKETDRLRRSKRATGWISLAASVCLVIGLGFFTLPALTASDECSHEAKGAPMEQADINRAPSNLYSDDTVEEGVLAADTAQFTATVTEACDTYIIVTPLEGEWERISYERIFISFPEDFTATLTPGQQVEIYYTGTFLEVSPAIPQNVIAIVPLTEKEETP